MWIHNTKKTKLKSCMDPNNNLLLSLDHLNITSLTGRACTYTSTDQWPTDEQQSIGGWHSFYYIRTSTTPCTVARGFSRYRYVCRCRYAVGRFSGNINSSLSSCSYIEQRDVHVSVYTDRAISRHQGHAYNLTRRMTEEVAIDINSESLSTSSVLNSSPVRNISSIWYDVIADRSMCKYLVAAM